MTMMKKLALTVVLAGSLAAMAAVATGDVGNLTPVANNPNAGIDGGALCDCQTEGFKAPAPDSGTVNPKAEVAFAKYKDTVVAVALDSQKPDAAAMDCVRLDFSGKGNFKGAPVVDLKAAPPTTQPAATQPGDVLLFQGSFDGANVQAVRDGRTFPVTVHGEIRSAPAGNGWA